MDPALLQRTTARHLDEVIALRRDLHQHPELSGAEERTARVVAERLRQAGLDVRTGVGGHGVVATLGEGRPCFLLRADMDALPLQEDTGLPWSSTCPGVAHACGHDFHTAWLVGAALVLRDIGLPRGCVKFVFQPAEEAIAGAAPMIEQGILEEPPVDAVCGAHTGPDLKVGEIALRPGPNLAAADRFAITVTGVGAHGAHPNCARDPIPVAAEIILALQTLVSRRLHPLNAAVLSVCRMAAGSAFNIIPDEAVLEGTVRTLRPEDRDMIEEAMGQLVASLAAAHGCTSKLDYARGVPATITDADVTDLARRALLRVMPAEQVKLQEQVSMGAEDFSLFLERCPGALLSVGCTAPGTEDVKSLHQPGFAGDDGCLQPAMVALSAIALEYLSQE